MEYRKALWDMARDIGLPGPEQVLADNPHGTRWVILDGGDQGEHAHPLDRFYARFESAEGYWADYFHVDGRWTLGAN